MHTLAFNDVNIDGPPLFLTSRVYIPTAYPPSSLLRSGLDSLTRTSLTSPPSLIRHTKSTAHQKPSLESFTPAKAFFAHNQLSPLPSQHEAYHVNTQIIVKPIATQPFYSATPQPFIRNHFRHRYRSNASSPYFFPKDFKTQDLKNKQDTARTVSLLFPCYGYIISSFIPEYVQLFRPSGKPIARPPIRSQYCTGAVTR